MQKKSIMGNFSSRIGNTYMFKIGNKKEEFPTSANYNTNYYCEYSANFPQDARAVKEAFIDDHFFKMLTGHEKRLQFHSIELIGPKEAMNHNTVQRALEAYDSVFQLTGRKPPKYRFERITLKFDY